MTDLPARPTIATLGELRALVQVLRDADGDVPLAPQPGLDDLPSLVEASRRLGVPVTLDLDVPERRPPTMVEHAVYRATQEALTNVLKHAAARWVSVVLQRSPGQVSAVVEDDGRGFDTDSPGPAGAVERRLGVIGMRERMALVGGTLTIESNVGRGTTVIARVPLSEEGGDV